MLITAPEYHAHVYFRPEEAETIARLQAQAKQALAGAATVWPLRERPVGPHPEPMFEIEFLHAYRPAVLSWLSAHHDGRSVLLHPVTGNDLRDHQENAVWLGAPLQLDFSRLSGEV